MGTDEKSEFDGDFRQARFSIDLNLPEPGDELLEDVRQAVRREFRDSVKWKHLRCRNVRVVSETETGSVYELKVGHSVEFDWTWEGAVAFRPLVLEEFGEEEATIFDDGVPEIEDSVVWSGEVLEVDEAAGRIFVVAANPEHFPRRGSF